MTISKVRVTGKTVRTLDSEKVVFDPYNADHRQAFRIVIMAGKQTDLRFELEGFTTVPSMMLYKMAVFGAGAIDEVSENTRVALAKRAHLHAVPVSRVERVIIPFTQQYKAI